MKFEIRVNSSGLFSNFDLLALNASIEASMQETSASERSLSSMAEHLQRLIQQLKC